MTLLYNVHEYSWAYFWLIDIELFVKTIYGLHQVPLN